MLENLRFQHLRLFLQHAVVRRGTEARKPPRMLPSTLSQNRKKPAPGPIASLSETCSDTYAQSANRTTSETLATCRPRFMASLPSVSLAQAGRAPCAE